MERMLRHLNARALDPSILGLARPILRQLCAGRIGKRSDGQGGIDRNIRLPPYRIVGSNSESAGRVPDTSDMAGKQLSTQRDQSSWRARHRAIHAEDG